MLLKNKSFHLLSEVPILCELSLVGLRSLSKLKPSPTLKNKLSVTVKLAIEAVLATTISPNEAVDLSDPDKLPVNCNISVNNTEPCTSNIARDDVAGPPIITLPGKWALPKEDVEVIDPLIPSFTNNFPVCWLNTNEEDAAKLWLLLNCTWPWPSVPDSLAGEATASPPSVSILPKDIVAWIDPEKSPSSKKKSPLAVTFLRFLILRLFILRSWVAVWLPNPDPDTAAAKDAETLGNPLMLRSLLEVMLPISCKSPPTLNLLVTSNWPIDAVVVEEPLSWLPNVTKLNDPVDPKDAETLPPANDKPAIWNPSLLLIVNVPAIIADADIVPSTFNAWVVLVVPILTLPSCLTRNDPLFMLILSYAFVPIKASYNSVIITGVIGLLSAIPVLVKVAIILVPYLHQLNHKELCNIHFHQFLLHDLNSFLINLVL